VCVSVEWDVCVCVEREGVCMCREGGCVQRGVCVCVCREGGVGA